MAATPGVSDEEVRFTHGPILGRLGAHEIGIWARTSRPATFRVRYGLQPNRLNLLSPAPGTRTRLERDNTGHVYPTGLRPNTKYYYRLVLPESKEVLSDLGGSFRTLPDAADFGNPEHNPRGLFNFSFEFGCGNNQNPKSYGGMGDVPAYKIMLPQLGDKIHFAILNGDWLYEEKRDYSREQWLSQVRIKAEEMPAIVSLAPTIVGVWENYKLYLERGKNLAAWHREIPSFFTYDDHEILNDVYGTGEVGLRDRRAVFRDIAVQAWYDYLGWSNPVAHRQGIYFGRAELRAGSDILTDRGADFHSLDLDQANNLHVHWGGTTAGADDPALDGVGGDPNAGVYDIVEVVDQHRLRIRPPAKQDGHATYSIGRRSYGSFRVSNCEFYLLDTRGHRQMHSVRQPDKPGVSMLGSQQKTWLMDAMAKSDADFFFMVSSVNFMIPHRGAGGIIEVGENKDEAWTVFLEEREQLIRFWDSLEKPVFVLTGDLHNSFAIKITDRIWEFASGPHSTGSLNHPAGSEGGRPPNGEFDSMGRKCEIRWSTYILDDTPPPLRLHPVFCVVQVNNVFNNPKLQSEDRWVAFPRRQAIFKYYDGLTGELLYAESILAAARRTNRNES